MLAFAIEARGLLGAALPRPDHFACAGGGFPLGGKVVLNGAMFWFTPEESQDFRLKTPWLGEAKDSWETLLARANRSRASASSWDVIDFARSCAVERLAMGPRSKS